MSDANQIISCPGCQAKMRVGTAASYRCPKCGQTFQLRGAAAPVAPASSAKPTPKQPPAKQPPAKQPPSKPSPVKQPTGQPVLPASIAAPASFPSPANFPVQSKGAGAPTQATATAAKGAGSASFRKYGWLMAAGLGLLLLGGVGIAALVIMKPQLLASVLGDAKNAPPQGNEAAAAAPNQAAEGAVADQGNKGAVAGAGGQNANRSTPYVGLDQIIWKPGDKMPEREAGDGPRTPLVGHSMQANEVRTVEWKIVQSYGFAGDRKSTGEQTMRAMQGYIADSLVIDEVQKVVRLQYKGTVLTAGQYRTQLELATEMNLDPEPRFP